MNQRRPSSVPQSRRSSLGSDRSLQASTSSALNSSTSPFSTSPNSNAYITSSIGNANTPVIRGAMRTMRDRENAQLRQMILSSLTRLNDRDTLKTAVDELNRIAESVDADGLALFLSCLYDSTDESNRATVRKEVVRVFATLIKLHPSIIVSSLSKIFAKTLKQLKDQDSSLREASADTIGCIASNIQYIEHLDEEEDSPLASKSPRILSITFIYRSLFALFNEQNKNQQIGAACALRKVVQSTEANISSELPMLSPRLVKLTTQPTCLARPHIVNVATTLIEVSGDAISPYLNSLIGSFIESLASEEWSLRKSAAEALGTCALKLETLMDQYRPIIMIALEKARFDKIKPVRDTIAETIQIYRSTDENQGINPLLSTRGESPRVSDVVRHNIPRLEISVIKRQVESPSEENMAGDSSMINQTVYSDQSIESESPSPVSSQHQIRSSALDDVYTQIKSIAEQQIFFMQSMGELKAFLQSSMDAFGTRLSKLEQRIDTVEKSTRPVLLYEHVPNSKSTQLTSPDRAESEVFTRTGAFTSSQEATKTESPSNSVDDSSITVAIESEDIEKIEAFMTLPGRNLHKLHHSITSGIIQLCIRLLREGRNQDTATLWIRRFVDVRYPFSLQEKSELTKIFRQSSLVSTPHGVEATRIYATLLRYSYDAGATKLSFAKDELS